MKQNDIAYKLDSSQQAISNLERNSKTLTLDNFIKYVNAVDLEISLSDKE